jgi:hypothetical protein
VGVHRYIVRCYRKTPDDVVELAGQMLLAYFNDPKRPPERKPHIADLEDEHRQIVARIRVIGPDKIERMA